MRLRPGLIPFFALSSAAIGLLPGCSTEPVLQSQPLGARSAEPNFHVADYRLARALLPVSLKKSGTTYAVQIDPPNYSGDPSAAYMVHYDASASSSDQFTVAVAPSTRLLTGINLTTEDKTDAIIVKAVESAAAVLENAPATAPGAVTPVDYQLDPSDPDQVASLRAMLKRASGGKVVEFDITPVAGSVAAAAGMPAADCSIGFCYRVPLPYRVTYGFSNGPQFSKEILLPNRGPVIAVPLTRAAFVKKVINVGFENGTPNSVAITKPSEALEFAALPLDIAKAILSVPAAIVKLRIDLSDKEKSLADTEKQRLENEKALRETRNELALEGGPPIGQQRVFMFGASGPWGQAGELRRSPTPAGPVDGGNHGQLEPVGGNHGGG